MCNVGITCALRAINWNPGPKKYGSAGPHGTPHLGFYFVRPLTIKAAPCLKRAEGHTISRVIIHNIQIADRVITELDRGTGGDSELKIPGKVKGLRRYVYWSTVRGDSWH